MSDDNSRQGSDEEPGSDKHKSDPWISSKEVNQELDGHVASDEGTVQEFERDLLNRLAFASLVEQRRSRRWGIFFKFLIFGYFGVVLSLFFLPSGFDRTGASLEKHTALVDLTGVIAADADASADNLVSGLRRAFRSKKAVAVILRINSPGGSPVQSGYIYDEIKRLRQKYPDKKLYAVITDICASGGYYVAAAADEIYANKASIVGSIGVLMNGFGFVNAMKKLGIERRLLTAGSHKGILDPFSPIQPDERQHVQELLNKVHEQFISAVKKGRGERLGNSPEIFSGLFWNGEEGLKLGLIDGLGSSSYVAREVVGSEKIINYTLRDNYFERIADRIGVKIGSVLMSALGINQSRIQ